jgi:hypothetical protein
MPSRLKLTKIHNEAQAIVTQQGLIHFHRHHFSLPFGRAAGSM